MGDQSEIEWTELGRDVDGFDGYRVGADGSVWSRWAYNGHQPRRLGESWRLLKPQPDGDGYLALQLYRGGRPHRRKVHLLVLEAFVGPRPDGLEGCHNNGILTDCSVSNLRWDTPSANQRDRLAHGTSPRGNGCGRARLDEAAVRAIRAARAAGESRASLAARFGVSPSTISAAARGQNWRWLAQA